MPILLAIVAALGGALWFWIRNNPRDAMSVADDAVTIARNAPRRIAFRRQTKAHAVEGIEDARLAVATLGQAFIALDDLPTKESRDRLHVLLRALYRVDEETGQELATLSQWLVDQCGGAQPTVPRVGKRLMRIDADASWDDMLGLFGDLALEGLSTRQQEAVTELRRIFRK